VSPWEVVPQHSLPAPVPEMSELLEMQMLARSQAIGGARYK
jgi:hypothetical protein